jgi:hypothetical protein
MTDEDCVTVFSRECHPACAGLPYLFYPVAVFLLSLFAGGAQAGVCSSVPLFAGCVAGFNLSANASMA